MSVGLRPSNDSNTVNEFIDRRLSLDKSYRATPKSKVYQWYADWCRAADIEPVTQHKFTKKLLRHPAVSSERAYIEGEQRRCFVGVVEKPLAEAD